MTESPSDYGLPHPGWRPSQKQLLDAVLNMQSPATLIVEAPTGFGKTGVVAAVGHEDKALALMLTKDLQDQYSRIYDFDTIYGRSNYPCTHPKYAKSWQKAYGYPRSADDCPYPKMKDCDISCPYKTAKAAAHGSNKVAMNYSYGWFAEWWHHRDGYLFADEAHNLAISVISNLAQLRVSERQRNNWNLPKFPACSGTTDWAKDEVFEWLEHAIPIMGGTIGQMKDSKDKSKGTLLHRRLVMLRQLLTDGIWHIKGTNIGNKEIPPHLVCRPVNPKVFAPRLLGHHSKVVLMSATIGDSSMLASELGIEDYEFKSFPHNIDPSRRPVFWYEDAPRMNYRSTYQDYEHQADIIAEVCRRHKGERILIHTTRWKHARDLADRLARKGLQDRVWVPEQGIGRIQQIQKLVNPTQTDLIAIGPSFWEGLDLKDDLCRCVIIAKVPFSDRSDPVVAARLRQPGGIKWDHWCAALKVVQGAGRGVRDADDYAATYICDANWSGVAKYAPKWFEIQT